MTDSFILTIENGPQQGASLELAIGINRVGGALDNDVVIADDSIAVAHFVIECGVPSILRALASGVRLGSGKSLHPGERYTARQTLGFSAGNIRFRLDQFVTAVEPIQTDWRSRLVAPVALAVSAICLLVILAPAAETTGVARPLVGTMAVSPIKAPVPTDWVALVQAIAARLSMKSLAGLTAAAKADGAVEVRGALTSDQVADWNETKYWFDSHYGARAVLVDHTTLSAPVAPLTVAAVHPGPSPFVIDRAGQKLFQGSPLPGGWMVDRIETDRVIVRRNGQLLAVRF